MKNTKHINKTKLAERLIDEMEYIRQTKFGTPERDAAVQRFKLASHDYHCAPGSYDTCPKCRKGHNL